MQKAVVLSIHNQNSPSLPIRCPALRHKNNAAFNLTLQIIGSHHQLDNEISGIASVYSSVTCVSVINCQLHLSDSVKVWF